MNNITKSLYDLALRQGVDFKFNSLCLRNISSNKRAIGVMVGENLMNLILLFLIWILFRLIEIY